MQLPVVWKSGPRMRPLVLCEVRHYNSLAYGPTPGACFIYFQATSTPTRLKMVATTEEAAAFLHLIAGHHVATALFLESWMRVGTTLFSSYRAAVVEATPR